MPNVAKFRVSSNDGNHIAMGKDFLGQLQLNFLVKCSQFGLQSFQFIFFLPLLFAISFKSGMSLARTALFSLYCSIVWGMRSNKFFDERSGKAERMKFRGSSIGSDRAVKPLISNPMAQISLPLRLRYPRCCGVFHLPRRKS